MRVGFQLHMLPGQADHLGDPQPGVDEEFEEEVPVVRDGREQSRQLGPGQGDDSVGMTRGPRSRQTRPRPTGVAALVAGVRVDSCRGIRVTVGCGVSASRRGEAFDFDAVFHSADAALYEAK